MRIGIPTELKADETRVAVTPQLVEILTQRGHTVTIQSDAGLGAGYDDNSFGAVGATIVSNAGQVWDASELIIKVKEPIGAEYPQLRPDHVVFSYLHLAASPECTQALVDSGCVALAFETVRLPDGTLPLLAPMSAIAGRLAVQYGAHFLTARQGGRGVLLGGLDQAPAASMIAVGAGVAGTHAAVVAAGMGAAVTVVDRNPARVDQLVSRLGDAASGLLALDADAFQSAIATADLVVLAALVPGAHAPIVLTNELLDSMPARSVVVDIAIDQGGNCEAARPTTHHDPVFESHGVLVSCITNLPAAVPRTATVALAAAITPHVLAIADYGWLAAIGSDPALAGGLSVLGGRVVHPELL